MAHRQTIAVAIPTFGREAVLIDTIAQALAQDPPAGELIVVDQTAQHEPSTAAYLQDADRRGALRWLRQTPANLPAARNRALGETTCDIVLFVDDDVTLGKDLVERHRANYDDPSVAAVAGRTTHSPSRRRAECSRDVESDYRNFDFESTARVENVACLLGANHSVRRSDALTLGGYDENYLAWAYREETDLAMRLYRAGRKIVFDPTAELHHLSAPSGGCRLSGWRGMTQEWKVSFPGHYFAWKHLFPQASFWRECAINFRKFALRRDNIRSPARLACGVLSYGAALAYAWWRLRRTR